MSPAGRTAVAGVIGAPGQFAHHSEGGCGSGGKSVPDLDTSPFDKVDGGAVQSGAAAEAAR